MDVLGLDFCGLGKFDQFVYEEFAFAAVLWVVGFRLDVLVVVGALAIIILLLELDVSTILFGLCLIIIIIHEPIRLRPMRYYIFISLLQQPNIRVY